MPGARREGSVDDAHRRNPLSRALGAALSRRLESAPTSQWEARPRPDAQGCAGAARALLERQDIALVVSDIQMERLDGLSLLRHLKIRRAELPVLLMTAYGTVPQAVQAMGAGAGD